MLKMKVIGSEKIQAKIKTMEDKEKIERALDMCAMLVERDAKRLCPVDTGRLRASIDTIKKELARFIGTSVYYAPYQEFGTRYMQPNSFLRPALEMNRYKFKKIFEDEYEHR